MAGSRVGRLLVVVLLAGIELPALRGQQMAGRAVAAIPANYGTSSSASLSAITSATSATSPVEPEKPTFTRSFGFLQQLTHAAGIVFSGRVASVAKADPFGGSGSTLITFEVEHALLGAIPGQILTVREWAGHWENGEHYRVGERVFLFLFPPGKSGLTSAVGGSAGKFALDNQGGVLVKAGNGTEFVNDPDAKGSGSSGNVIRYADFVQAIRQAMDSNGAKGNERE